MSRRISFLTLTLLSVFVFQFGFFLSSVTIARAQDACQLCKENCELNAPGDATCMSNNCPNCNNVLRGQIYCWCDEGDKCTENIDSKKNPNQTTPFQNCQECTDFCGAKPTKHCDYQRIDWNEKSVSEGGCKKFILGSSVDLSNPISGIIGGSTDIVTGAVGRIVQAVVSVMGAFALLAFIYGGILWMTAGGNDKQVGKAKEIIKKSVLGVLLIVFSYILINFFIGAFKTASGKPTTSAGTAPR